MKTKIFSAFFILFLCLAAVGAVNASADTYGDLTYEVSGNSGNTIEITGCNKSAANVVIPSEIDGKAVTSIGDSAFRNCTSLASVTIPDSVTSIGYNAFSDCTSLASITIPGSVTRIGQGAFWGTQFYNNEANWENGVLYCGKYLLSAKTSITECNIKKDTKLIANSAFSGCTGLTSITIPDSVTSIGERAFYGCSNLNRVDITDLAAWCKKSIGNCFNYTYDLYLNGEPVKNLVIPDGITCIGEYAFSLSSIMSVTIPDSVTSIGVNAFSYCQSLNRVDITDLAAWCKISIGDCFDYTYDLYLNGEPVKNLVIPYGITCIGKYAFSRSSIISVTIPDGVTSIGGGAFSNCTSLASITIPGSVTSIGRGAFSGCRSLTSVTIPDSVTSIGASAFYGCSSLTSVTIPDGVTSIGGGAFSNCTSLASVTIPDSVTSIGEFAFSSCENLNRVDITDLAAWCKISIGDCFDYTYDLYLNGEPVKNLVIPYGITCIGKYAFSRSSIISVTIPDGVTSIGRYAFEYCSSIESVTIPDSVTSIGGGAFSNCTSLASVTIPDSVTSIGLNAFYGCSNLNRVDITDLAAWCKKSIGNCFNYTYDLYLNGEPVKNLVIPDGVTSIGAFAFSHSSIMSVTILDSVMSIGYYAFEYCSSIESVTIPDSVTSIGGSAFYGCSSLTGITIPDSVTSIGLNAFYGCSSLTSITIPDSVTSIGDSAFRNCTSLASVTIPDSVTSIFWYAFSGCKNIKYVFFKGSRDFWDNEMLIYKGNDTLKNAEIICDAKEKTYNFVTNCEKTLSPVTAYYIAGAPNTETLSRKKYVTGWYDNPVFSGVPVKFPYYSDKTTLYAKWADRTGKSFESAVYVPENGSSAITANDKYWIFVPEKTGEYIFKFTAGNYLYLYKSNKTQLASGSNSITFSLAAGEVYYIKGHNFWSSYDTLTVTQAGYKGTSTAISNNGKKIRILPNKIETGTKITVALYNGDKFVGTKVATYQGGAIEFTTNTEYTTIKVMAWNADNLTPCAKAEVVER